MRNRVGQASPRGNRGSTNSTGVGLVALLVALVILAIAPVTTYDCAAGSNGATCRIDERVAGLVALRSTRVDGIVGASSSSRSSVYRQAKRKQRAGKETRTTLVLTGRENRVLYEDEQRESAGIETSDVAGRVAALSMGQGTAFFAWQVPLVASIFASLGFLVGVPSVVAGVAETVGRKKSLPGGIAAGATLLALLVAWAFAVFGGP